MNLSLFRLSTGNYSLIYLKDGRSLLVSKCLERLEQCVPENSVLRIHKSYLINPRFVECVLDKQIKLINGSIYAV